MSGISRRERNLILAAAAVAVVVGVPALMGPTAGSLGRRRSLAEERKRRTQVMERLTTATAESRRLQETVDRSVFKGSARELTDRMVHASQAAAVSAHLRLTDLKPLSIENDSGVRKVPLQVTLSSKFPQAVRFLYELERAGSRFRVDQLQLTAADPHSDQLELQLRLVGYVKEDEERDAARS